jgi:hypothetical protein
MKRILALALFLALAAIPAAAWFVAQKQTQNVKEYTLLAYRYEREFITRVPIYEDFSTPEKEQKLRTFLLMDHLAVAEKSGVPPLESKSQIQQYVKDGTLIDARQSEDANYHYYNVPAEFRYLTPKSRKGLELIAQRFQENLKKRYADHPPVRIAVSSILRTLDYQKDLQRKNANASFASSHSYGVSFDLFYDDYYVKLPPPPAGVPDELRTRLGYLLGDSLMRQFRAVLMETLLELQEERKLYAILEKNQRCYHVTILE